MITLIAAFIALGEPVREWIIDARVAEQEFVSLPPSICWNNRY